MARTFRQNIVEINESLLHYYNLNNDEIIKRRLINKFDYIEERIIIDKNPLKFIRIILNNNILQYFQKIKYERGQKALTRKRNLDKLLSN